jgi:VWFA-related protein
MRRWAVAVVAGLTACASIVSARQEAVFRASADAVTVGVSVRRGNRPVTGLTVLDFAVTDNGVKQTIAELSYERRPIDLTVLLDVSGSISQAVLDQLRQATGDLRAALQPQDRLRVVSFNMRVHQVLDWNAPASAMPAAFSELAPAGSSAVFDALAVALASHVEPDRRQFVTLFSDGRDSISITSAEMLLDTARRTTPTVSVVLASPVRRPAEHVYTELADETGGAVITLLPRDRLGDGFEKALDQFRSSYVLSYLPQGVPWQGAHTIAVRVGRNSVDVRARRGYVVP